MVSLIEIAKSTARNDVLASKANRKPEVIEVETSKEASKGKKWRQRKSEWEFWKAKTQSPLKRDESGRLYEADDYIAVYRKGNCSIFIPTFPPLTGLQTEII